MKECEFRILENKEILGNSPTGNIYRMKLAGDTEAITTPGQFVNIRLSGHFLRRPISVNDLEDGILTLLYKVVGEGTTEMSEMLSGQKLQILTGLGNGFDISQAGDHPVLVGGGIGTAPLYLLAKEIKKNMENKDQECRISVVLGFRTAEEIFYRREFEDLGCEVIIATEDGSEGTKGFVTDALPEEFSYLYTCGPEPMLKAVFRKMPGNRSGQFSFEERMGCGFGACMGCSCKTVTGYKRICKDGPILRKEEILWEN